MLPLVGLAAEVGRVGVAGDDPQRELLAAAADQDLRVRLLHRLGVALRAVEREVLARRSVTSGSVHIAFTISTVSRSTPMRSLALRELVAVAVELVLVPAGADAPDRAGRPR